MLGKRQLYVGELCDSSRDPAMHYFCNILYSNGSINTFCQYYYMDTIF